LGLSNSLGLP